jgi:16S rRNA (adenine1518-N6/adenine1519-N6)-dimethyltransferase
MAIDLRSIPTPGELLRKHGLSPRKSWGQNFLHDRSVHAHIVRAAGATGGRRVVEIGAGLGTLTCHLLATGAEVWAIERDRDLCEVLRQELGHLDTFQLYEADAVRFDYSCASDEAQPRPSIVGNLPYQLTGPLLFKLLDHDAVTGAWVVMVQREVADRLCSPPGSKRYGGLTAAMSRVRAPRKVCDVGSGSFLPPPRVDSAVVRLDPLPQVRGEVGDPKAYLELVRKAFQQRRKTLLNSLSVLAPKDVVRAWCETAGVDPGLRAERLGPEEFSALARAREAQPGVDGELPAEGEGDA